MTKTDRLLFESLQDSIRKFNRIHGTHYALDKVADCLSFNVLSQKDRWVQEVAKEAYDLWNNGHIGATWDMTTNVVVVQMKPRRGHNFGPVGIARCSPADCFDSSFGLALAYARAKGLEIPSYVLE